VCISDEAWNELEEICKRGKDLVEEMASNLIVTYSNSVDKITILFPTSKGIHKILVSDDAWESLQECNEYINENIDDIASKLIIYGSKMLKENLDIIERNLQNPIEIWTPPERIEIWTPPERIEIWTPPERMKIMRSFLEPDWLSSLHYPLIDPSLTAPLLKQSHFKEIKSAAGSENYVNPQNPLHQESKLGGIQGCGPLKTRLIRFRY